MHIPWFTLPPIDLTSIGLGKIYWFAIFVVTAIVVGVMLYDRFITRGGDVEYSVARVVPEAAVIGGFIGAHLVHVLAYHPELMDEDPWILLKFWAGISSIGGFFGGAVAVAGLLYYRKQAMVPYADRLLFALSVAWIFGRLGCATSHDHPGKLTDFFMGVAFPDGIRHDLGLYEFLFTALLLVPLLMWLSRRPFKSGTLVAAIVLTYAPMRFGLDFLRATDRDFVDSRYGGLTPAQYGVMAMFAAGLYLLLIYRRTAALQPPLWGPDAVTYSGPGATAPDNDNSSGPLASGDGASTDKENRT